MTFKMQKTATFSKIVTNCDPDEAQNFWIQKYELHRIMEDRITFHFKNKKPQRSSFKITTCERCQLVNNDDLQELCQVRQQLGPT